MNFYTSISIGALVIFIIALTLYGVYFSKIDAKPFPETHEICPKLWSVDKLGRCIIPIDTSLNRIFPVPRDTPGRRIRGFNPSDPDWDSYDGQTSSVCGKHSWANKYSIIWDGISNYNSC